MVRRNRVVTAALIPVLVAAGAGWTAATATGTAAAATVTAAPAAGMAKPQAAPGPWSTPTPLTSADEANWAGSVAIASDGSAVTMWSRETGTRSWESWTATRPPKSTVWGPARRLAADSSGGGFLHTADDGSVTAVWQQASGAGFAYSMSSFIPGSGTWTPVTQIAQVTEGRDLTLAGNPSGKLVALWIDEVMSHPNGWPTHKLYVSERSNSDGSWSTPLNLTDDPAEAPTAFVEPDGTTTLAWSTSDYFKPEGHGVHVLTRAAGAADWGAPVTISGSASSQPTNRAVMTRSASGAAVLGWNTSERSKFAYRPAGSTQWGPAEDVPQNTERVSKPLIGPDGDVTFVWGSFEWDEAAPPRGATETSTRAPDGTWSPVRTLSTNLTSNFWDASIGADGTIHTYWTERTADRNVSDVFTASRNAGVWTRPTGLGRNGTYESGSSATGRDGEATVVWTHRPTSAWLFQVFAAGTGLTTPKPGHRDYVGGDGFPDLFARASTGAVSIYKGNASQTVNERVSAGTWPADSTLVPFGDLNGDGSNDVLVRDGSGALYRYGAPRGTAVTPQSPATKIGSGWSGFDALLHSGDLTGDGVPDLVARDTASGDLYLYGGTKTGGVTAAGRIGTNWKSLTVVGPGDLNGDGHADLLARTVTGDLYRYFGTGQATIQRGVVMGTGWSGFRDIVGVGDLTGDGKNDIVACTTTTGELYRYGGDGAGGITRGVKIGTGWQDFASLH